MVTRGTDHLLGLLRTGAGVSRACAGAIPLTQDYKTAQNYNQRDESQRASWLHGARSKGAGAKTARGRCVYCGSLAVEKRPSKPNGAPAPWAQIGRRIGSFEHCQWRARGGDNDLSNIAWACLWCNTWESERRKGATDHGGFHPPPDDPAAIDTLVRPNLLARLKLRLKKARADEARDDWLSRACRQGSSGTRSREMKPA
jgi:hypothetical protein